MDTDDLVINLLADRTPTAARDLMLAWSERRYSSWANAARDSEVRAASSGHLPQIRGQLRYHLGEAALVEAARSANIGAMPLRTTPPGGIFIVARVGRFALVSVSATDAKLMPRVSLTRKLLRQPNESLDPQNDMFAELREKPRVVTDLAYFGCLVSVPDRRDPTAPAQLALGVPNANVSDWISWIPLTRLHGLLQQKVDAAGPTPIIDGNVADKAFPRFRLPNSNKGTGDDGKAG